MRTVELWYECVNLCAACEHLYAVISYWIHWHFKELCVKIFAPSFLTLKNLIVTLKNLMVGKALIGLMNHQIIKNAMTLMAWFSICQSGRLFNLINGLIHSLTSFAPINQWIQLDPHWLQKLPSMISTVYQSWQPLCIERFPWTLRTNGQRKIAGSTKQGRCSLWR
jgi:hypothetical protein